LDKELFLLEKEASRAALFIYARNLCLLYRLKNLIKSKRRSPDEMGSEEAGIWHLLSDCSFNEQQVIICIHILKLSYRETEKILSLNENQAEEIEKNAVRKLSKKMESANLS
jgi:DNA-directed RNA polymerase specialized sigma24 family protein